MSLLNNLAPRRCPECDEPGVFVFEWAATTVPASYAAAPVNGRLTYNDVKCVFVLGCTSCSATAVVVDAETVARRLTEDGF